MYEYKKEKQLLHKVQSKPLWCSNQTIYWDEQVATIRRIMSLINGRALEYDLFIQCLSSIQIGLTSAIKNQRSALVKHTCLLISQLARELGSRFDSIGDYIKPLSITKHDKNHFGQLLLYNFNNYKILSN